MPRLKEVSLFSYSQRKLRVLRGPRLKVLNSFLLRLREERLLRFDMSMDSMWLLERLTCVRLTGSSSFAIDPLI